MKRVIYNYSFSASAKTITLLDFSATFPVALNHLLIIVDTTTNQILYNFADPSVAQATISSNNVVTLSAMAAGPHDTDKLHIVYDDQITRQGLLTGAIPDEYEVRYALGSANYYDPSSGTTYTGVDGGAVYNPSYLSLYLGYAIAGSAITSAVWNVLRFQVNSSGDPVRQNLETGVAWLTASGTTINGGALFGAW